MPSYVPNLQKHSTEPPLRPFSTFLLPSLAYPFRRRKPSLPASLVPPEDDMPSLSSSPTSTPSSPDQPTPSYLPAPHPDHVFAPPRQGHLSRMLPDTLRCSVCATDFAFASQVVSKGFTGRQGRAYLVAPPMPGSVEDFDATRPPKPARLRDLANIKVGEIEHRQLVTGWHEVADIACKVCNNTIGWKYVDAKDESQKYKVGKFILEATRVVGFKTWEDVFDGDSDEVGWDTVPAEWRAVPAKKGEQGDVVEFDSEDEDECEDLFTGVWDPVLASRRRSKRLAER